MLNLLIFHVFVNIKMSFYKRFNILKIEIYKFVGGIGVKGSFGGLYTFLEVAD